MKTLLRSFFGSLFLFVFGAFLPAQVPDRMTWCGMDLEVEPGAQTKIQETLDLLHRSPKYFQTLVDKADTYLPFVEEAFSYLGVPDDLKYIVLQESALRGDAVSSSNAVGFWQMKAQAATEAGLMVNDQVDERRHIFRSSLGAGRYFWYINQKFDNWLYAVIGYNQGPAGALAHIDPAQYGKKKMRVTGGMHPYALKALAHKLAFESAIYRRESAPVFLTPVSTSGEVDLDKVAAVFGEVWDQLVPYNLWALSKKLPEGKSFTVYLPREGGGAAKHIADPVMAGAEKGALTGFPLANKVNGGASGNAQTGGSVAGPGKGAAKIPAGYQTRDLGQDPEMGMEYAQVKKGENWAEFAVRNHEKATSLAKWNGLTVADELVEGQILRLKPPQKAKYHLVASGETWKSIASGYGLEAEALAAKNRMKISEPIFVGQKLWLKKKKPKGRPSEIFILGNEPNPSPKGEEAPVEKPPVGHSKIHAVKSGETLWGISQNYGVTVEALKKANRLSSNEIKVGQELIIPAR